jgi:hypothetical protein
MRIGPAHFSDPGFDGDIVIEIERCTRMVRLRAAEYRDQRGRCDAEPLHAILPFAVDDAVKFTLTLMDGRNGPSRHD